MDFEFVLTKGMYTLTSEQKNEIWGAVSEACNIFDLKVTRSRMVRNMTGETIDTVKFSIDTANGIDCWVECDANHRAFMRDSDGGRIALNGPRHAIVDSVMIMIPVVDPAHFVYAARAKKILGRTNTR